MKFSPRIILFLVILGAWVVIYFSYVILLPNFTASNKFDLNKYENIFYFLNTGAGQAYFAYNVLPETDYNKLINISFDFPLISFVCEDANPILLIIIHSSSSHFAKRKVIRETWGRNDEDVKLLFFLGSTLSQEISENVRLESDKHRDIVQGNFLDSYRNLTYKHTMALKYVVYHCPHTKYVLKTDDDIFVNMPLMKNFLIKDLSPLGAKKLLMCPVVHNAKPYRTYKSKWRVSFDEYPHKYYPTYCLGWAILYSPDVIFDFYKEAQQAKYFWIDDVFITGLVARNINFSNHVDISPLLLSPNEINCIMTHSENTKNFLFGNADMEQNQIEFLWKFVLNNTVAESIRQ